MKRATIAVYMASNYLVEVFRDIIEWNKPLVCGGIAFLFLTASAVTTFMGDNGVFWTCIILSFILPKLVMRRSKRQEQK